HGGAPHFLLSARRHPAAAERFLVKALGGANHPHPRVINTDKDAAYPPAIVRLKSRGCSGGELPTPTRCSTSITSWNRIPGPSNTGCAPAIIFVHSGELGAQLPATRRCI